MAQQTLTIGDYVKVGTYPGVAWWFVAHPLVFDDTCVLCEYGDHDGEDACRDYDQAIVRMVGDDRDFTVSTDDITRISGLEFCHDCGQMGCTSNVYD